MSFEIKKKKEPISQINVTPLVDVMLVLLVIFMISAPLMYSGINLKLPKTKKVSSLQLSKKKAILSIDPEMRYFLGDKQIDEKDLSQLLIKELKVLEDQTVYIRASYSLTYGFVANVMANLKRNGINSLSLVTEIKK